MALRLEVCSVSDVPDGEARSFEVEGLSVPVLVIRRGERFIATSGMCPHEDVELIDGDITDTLVICPGHGYSFELETGRCGHDPSLCLPVYEVVIEEQTLSIVLARRS